VGDFCHVQQRGNPRTSFAMRPSYSAGAGPFGRRITSVAAARRTTRCGPTMRSATNTAAIRHARAPTR